MEMEIKDAKKLRQLSQKGEYPCHKNYSQRWKSKGCVMHRQIQAGTQEIV